MTPTPTPSSAAGTPAAPAAEPGAVAPPDATPQLLFVDDEPSILNALKRLFRGKGYEIRIATSGAEGLSMLKEMAADLVISDMRMPEMDGAQFLEQVFLGWPDTKRILLTGYADASATIAAINRGKIWRYIAKPWNDEEILITVQQALAHRQLMHENARLTELTRLQNEELRELNAGLEQKVAERTAELRRANADLHSSFLATVQVFSNLIELREGRLAGHARRVADLARQLAERLGLEETEQRDVLLAGLLHDIGKVGLPDRLLEKAFNALPPADKTEFMKHPTKGQQLLLGVPQLHEAARIIRHHHECMDGSGYPDALGGLMIPLGARILAVANDYDALQSGSLALHPHTPREAQEFIVRHRGKRYDPTVVDAFLGMVTESAAGEEADLVVTVPELRPGMLLSRDLLHREGYLLLPRGRVVDAAVIANLQRLQSVEPQPLQIFVRRALGAAVLRDKPAVAPGPTFREVPMHTERLRPGLVLARNLNHPEGYLLLARGNRLDEGIIHQLREIEKTLGRPFTLYIREN